MKHLTIRTDKKKQIIDITDQINYLVGEVDCNEGVCIVFCQHTTAALTTADLDPGTDLDMLDAFEAIMPKLTYRHPHNPPHVTDHILSSMIGPSITIPIENNEL